MSAFKKLAQLALISAMSIGSRANASPSTLSTETAFLSGYDALLKNSLLTCAIEFESIKETIDELPRSLQERARLYRSYCNAGLKYKIYAAALFQEIDPKLLSAEDFRVYRSLRQSLREELQSLDLPSGWLFVYGGGGSFSPQSTESSSSLLGAFAGGTWRGLSTTIGVETFSLNLTGSSGSYKQTSTNMGFSYLIDKKWAPRIFASNVSVPSDFHVSTAVLGLGLSWYLSPKTSFDLEFSRSVYSDLIQLESVRANEVTLTVNQRLLSWQNSTTAMQITAETISTDASQRTDTTTGFVLNSRYQRWGVGVNTSAATWQFGAAAWTGSEALGVRNQGTSIYNTLRNYKSGYAFSGMWSATSNIALKIAGSREVFSVSSDDVASTTFVGGLLFSF
jgi:hypothetical protein